MTLADFSNLTQEQRAEHMFHLGSYLGCCMDRGNLYSMADFFVEVVYNDDENAIQEVNGFRDTAGLDPYLNEIEFSLNK